VEGKRKGLKRALTASVIPRGRTELSLVLRHLWVWFNLLKLQNFFAEKQKNKCLKVLNVYYILTTNSVKRKEFESCLRHWSRPYSEWPPLLSFPSNTPITIKEATLSLSNSHTSLIPSLTLFSPLFISFHTLIIYLLLSFSSSSSSSWGSLSNILFV